MVWRLRAVVFPANGYLFCTEPPGLVALQGHLLLGDVTAVMVLAGTTRIQWARYGGPIRLFGGHHAAFFRSSAMSRSKYSETLRPACRARSTSLGLSAAGMRVATNSRSPLGALLRVFTSGMSVVFLAGWSICRACNNPARAKLPPCDSAVDPSNGGDVAHFRMPLLRCLRKLQLVDPTPLLATTPTMSSLVPIEAFIGVGNRHIRRLSGRSIPWVLPPLSPMSLTEALSLIPLLTVAPMTGPSCKNSEENSASSACLLASCRSIRG